MKRATIANRERIQALGSINGWTFPHGVPLGRSSTVTVRCHNHIAEIGDPAVHESGYYEWTPLCAGLLGGSGCPLCNGQAPVTEARVLWNLACHGKATLVQPAEIESAKSRVLLRCVECGHEYPVSVFNIRASEYGCRPCANRNAKANGCGRPRVDEDLITARCAALGYQLLDLVPAGDHIRAIFICSAGRRHSQSTGNLLVKGCGCRTSMSLYEHMVWEVLEHITKHEWTKLHKRELRALFKVDRAHWVPHELDLICLALMVAIEVDGEHHDREITYSNKRQRSLARVIEIDRLKDHWCSERLILIRLKSDWLQLFKKADLSTRAEMLATVLSQHGIICTADCTDFTPKPLLLHQISARRRLSDMAAKRGYTLLSADYRGATSFHEFLCPDHGVFRRAPDSFGHGCLDCAEQIRVESRVSEGRESFLALLGDNYKIQAPYTNKTTKVLCLCVRHNIEFLALPMTCLIQGHVAGCRACRGERHYDATIGLVNRSHTRLVDLGGAQYSVTGLFVNTRTAVRCVCHVHRREFDAIPSNCFAAGKVMGCPECRHERCRVAGLKAHAQLTPPADSIEHFLDFWQESACT